mmetsp:Transcript_13293/g.30279  ORF Transcript_13293/g.30279 Transcript_13293/m.30279 type:complete len:213 (-) Transcript_13293:398-1036(-)
MFYLWHLLREEPLGSVAVAFATLEAEVWQLRTLLLPACVVQRLSAPPALSGPCLDEVQARVIRRHRLFMKWKCQARCKQPALSQHPIGLSNYALVLAHDVQVSSLHHGITNFGHKCLCDEVRSNGPSCSSRGRKMDVHGVQRTHLHEARDLTLVCQQQPKIGERRLGLKNIDAEEGTHGADKCSEDPRVVTVCNNPPFIWTAPCLPNGPSST